MLHGWSNLVELDLATTLEVSVGSLALVSGKTSVPPSVRGVLLSESPRRSASFDLWEHWSGGSMILEDARPFTGTQFRETTTRTQGVGQVKLARDAKKIGGSISADWVTNTCTVRMPWQPVIAITESGTGRPARTFVYYDCFPVRYQFPHLSVNDKEGDTREAITFQPARLEITRPR